MRFFFVIVATCCWRSIKWAQVGICLVNDGKGGARAMIFKVCHTRTYKTSGVREVNS